MILSLTNKLGCGTYVGILADSPYDPATLRDELEIDIRSGIADGVAIWNLPLAISGVANRQGIFAEHRLQLLHGTGKHWKGDPTPVKGWGGSAPLISYFPAKQPCVCAGALRVRCCLLSCYAYYPTFHSTADIIDR
jgi:hypothetical protein